MHKKKRGHNYYKTYKYACNKNNQPLFMNRGGIRRKQKRKKRNASVVNLLSWQKNPQTTVFFQYNYKYLLIYLEIILSYDANK